MESLAVEMKEQPTSSVAILMTDMELPSSLPLLLSCLLASHAAWTVGLLLQQLAVSEFVCFLSVSLATQEQIEAGETFAFFSFA